MWGPQAAILMTMRISLVPLRELAPLGESRVDDSAVRVRQLGGIVVPQVKGALYRKIDLAPVIGA